MFKQKTDIVACISSDNTVLRFICTENTVFSESYKVLGSDRIAQWSPRPTKANLSCLQNNHDRLLNVLLCSLSSTHLSGTCEGFNFMPAKTQTNMRTCSPPHGSKRFKSPQTSSMLSQNILLFSTNSAQKAHECIFL